MTVRDSKEYAVIRKFYGDRKAARSQVPLVNHIDEGIFILEKIGASEEAMKAFCLHPLFQADADLAQNQTLTRELDPYIVMLALEYRNTANAYLSQRKIEKLEDIRLSPLPEVNQMLMADKIQNCKDFMIHHHGIHPKSDELHQYFKNWFQRLGIPQKVFTALEKQAPGHTRHLKNPSPEKP